MRLDAIKSLDRLREGGTGDRIACIHDLPDEGIARPVSLDELSAGPNKAGDPTTELPLESRSGGVEIRLGSFPGAGGLDEAQEIDVALGAGITTRQAAEENDRLERHFGGDPDGFPEEREETDLRLEEGAS